MVFQNIFKIYLVLCCLSVLYILTVDKPEAHWPTGRQQSRLRHRSIGILSQRGMGHSQRAGRKARKVLSMLCWTVRGHILQHYPETANVVLHRQPDCALRRHILPVGAGVLPAGRFQGENLTLHHHSSVSDYVLLAHIGNHTIHITVASATRKIPVVHHVAGSPVRGRHYYHHKYSLSVRRQK